MDLRRKESVFQWNFKSDMYLIKYECIHWCPIVAQYIFMHLGLCLKWAMKITTASRQH